MKKIIAIILAVIMLVSLFGCRNVNGNDPVGTTDPNASVETTLGDHKHDHGEATKPTGSETTKPTTEPTTEPTAEPTTEPSATEHKHSYTDTVTNPTCEGKGYTEHVCECGDKYRDNEKPATGHNYKTTTVAPTQSSQGYDLHECTKCNKSYKDNYTAKLPADTQPPETQPSHKHSYTTSVVAPTCEGKGYTKYTCSCGDSYTSDEKPATGHNYKTVTVQPTQSSQGYDLHECTKCGHSYKDNYTAKLPTNNGGDSGENKGKYYDDGSAKWVEWNCASQGHHWGNDWGQYAYKTVREATCSQLQIVEYYCDVKGCGASEQREVANSYTNHLRSTDTMTGLAHMWQFRLIKGLTMSYNSEEQMKTAIRLCVTENDWVEYIEEYYAATFTDTYVCQTCGQTLGNGDLYTWVGEPPYKGYTVSIVYYTKDNQPDY